MAKSNRRAIDNSRSRREKLRRAVLASEEVCYLCGHWVDKALPKGHPMAPEVEHIIPIALGGKPYDRSNAALSHMICNRRKGASLAAPSTANPMPVSESW